MRRHIFVDMSAWIALVDESDRHHREAKAYYEQQIRQMGVDLITSDYIIDETLTLIRFGQKTWQEAVALFFRYADQRFSFTDCTSFALLSQEPVDAVFSFDRDFVVAGFLTEP